MRESVALLRRYRYDPGRDFGLVRILYTDRGAPGNRSSVDGARIHRLANTYMEVDSGRGIAVIPYHRVTEIHYGGKVVWTKEMK